MTLSDILICISHILEAWTLNEEDKARIKLKLEDLIAEHNVIDKEFNR